MRADAAMLLMLLLLFSLRIDFVDPAVLAADAATRSAQRRPWGQRLRRGGGHVAPLIVSIGQPRLLTRTQTADTCLVMTHDRRRVVT